MINTLKASHQIWFKNSAQANFCVIMWSWSIYFWNCETYFRAKDNCLVDKECEYHEKIVIRKYYERKLVWLLIFCVCVWRLRDAEPNKKTRIWKRWNGMIWDVFGNTRVVWILWNLWFTKRGIVLFLVVESNDEKSDVFHINKIKLKK